MITANEKYNRQQKQLELVYQESEKVLKWLKLIGFDADDINRSATDYGCSCYIYATHPNYRNTFKFRISDHEALRSGEFMFDYSSVKSQFTTFLQMHFPEFCERELMGWTLPNGKQACKFKGLKIQLD